MSEKRIADFSFIKRLPKKSGKKSTKIELLCASQFKDAWSVNIKNDFFPPLPYKYDDRLIYWDSCLFRVRVNGVWYRPKVNYTFLDWPEVMELLKEAI